jgi:tetratricopeptide (TPR) repeat protein
MPHDAAPNKDAIAMLERAVGLDPSYAPAWGALGLRYYFDSQYGGGGEGMFQRSNTAYERALALDPDLTSAAGQFIANRVERGDLARAYKDADALVKRQPGNAQAHMARSYVLRYAGLLDESALDCDATISLDPGNYLYRSCSLTFSQMGNPERGMDFLRLDPGSEWANANTVRLLWRESKMTEAREAAQKLPSEQQHLLRACSDHTLHTQSASPELDQVIHEIEPQAASNPDPENRYVFATTAAFCGGKATALRMLKTVIDAHYCAYTALQKDPLLASLRSAPEYAQLLSAAKQCQDTFVAETSQLSH